MLDPVKNAKSLGVLFLIGALFGSFGLLITLSTRSPLLIIIALLSAFFNYAIAIGLIKGKRWAIYALGGLILFTIITNTPNFLVGKSLELLDMLILLIHLVLFFWFFSARARFS